MARNARADDLEGRLIRFAIDIVTLGQLPQNFQAKHIAIQLLRALVNNVVFQIHGIVSKRS